jgi:hypothetical protein
VSFASSTPFRIEYEQFSGFPIAVGESQPLINEIPCSRVTCAKAPVSASVNPMIKARGGNTIAVRFQRGRNIAIHLDHHLGSELSPRKKLIEASH